MNGKPFYKSKTIYQNGKKEKEKEKEKEEINKKPALQRAQTLTFKQVQFIVMTKKLNKSYSKRSAKIIRLSFVK